ncbi:LBF_2804 family protein [Halomonas casei]|uniref:LBF_2804 family protein n=1 Tax=Halomonas casei TaxID=2742613 RepID=UPI003CE86A3A
MSLTRPDQEYAPAPGLAQRWANRYIQGYFRRHPALTAPNPQALKRTRRWIITWAAVAGMISGTLIGGAEWWMREFATDNWNALSLREQLPYWAGYMAVAGSITALEIGFLYWNALRGVASITRLAGLHYGQTEPLEPDIQLTVHGVSRVALEYPSPGNLIYGVDPHAYLGGWRITARALLYRLKISLSSFLLRLLLRRLLGRLTLRGFLPVLTGPLYAVWNAWIAARIIQEAYLQARGPALVKQLMATLADSDAPTRRLVAQGVGELIMRNQHPHPNLVLLLARLLDSLPDKPQAIDVDWPTTLHDYAQLTNPPRHTLLSALTQTALLSGTYRGSRKRFLKEVFATCQTPLLETDVKAQQQRLLSGEVP